MNNLTSITTIISFVDFLKKNNFITSNFDEIFSKLLAKIWNNQKSRKEQVDKEHIQSAEKYDKDKDLVRKKLSWQMPEKIKDKITLCYDRSLDCADRLEFCVHEIYWRLMRRVCARSCNFCVSKQF